MQGKVVGDGTLQTCLRNTINSELNRLHFVHVFEKRRIRISTWAFAGNGKPSGTIGTQDRVTHESRQKYPMRAHGRDHLKCLILLNTSECRRPGWDRQVVCEEIVVVTPKPPLGPESRLGKLEFQKLELGLSPA